MGESEEGSHSVFVCPSSPSSLLTLQGGKLLERSGSCKTPTETGIPFTSGNFTAIVVHFGIKKIRFGDFKSSPQWSVVC